MFAVQIFIFLLSCIQLNVRYGAKVYCVELWHELLMITQMLSLNMGTKYTPVEDHVILHMIFTYLLQINKTFVTAFNSRGTT